MNDNLENRLISLDLAKCLNDNKYILKSVNYYNSENNYNLYYNPDCVLLNRVPHYNEIYAPTLGQVINYFSVHYKYTIVYQLNTNNDVYTIYISFKNKYTLDFVLGKGIINLQKDIENKVKSIIKKLSYEQKRTNY